MMREYDRDQMPTDLVRLAHEVRLTERLGQNLEKVMRKVESGLMQ